MNAWQAIETAPGDTNILVATQGGWVDTAFWTDEDGEGRKWWWLVSANAHAKHPIHPNLVPTHWMPLPKHPEVAASANNEPLALPDQPSRRREDLLLWDQCLARHEVNGDLVPGGLSFLDCVSLFADAIRSQAPKRPLPGALVIAALLAMDTEARKRGEMFPQTADEQEADTKAIRRVVASLEFYTSGSQVSATGWPSVKDWPVLP